MNGRRRRIKEGKRGWLVVLISKEALYDTLLYLFYAIATVYS